MSTDQEALPETHVAPDGLYIPVEYREFTAQMVFRTPRATIQHFQSGGGQLDPHYGMIDTTHFGDPDDLYHVMNPGLAPDRVSLKPQGEDAVVLRVTSTETAYSTGGDEA